eukprot:5640446-Amphidinium_carterae.4
MPPKKLKSVQSIGEPSSLSQTGVGALFSSSGKQAGENKSVMDGASSVGETHADAGATPEKGAVSTQRALSTLNPFSSIVTFWVFLCSIGFQAEASKKSQPKFSP